MEVLCAGERLIVTMSYESPRGPLLFTKFRRAQPMRRWTQTSWRAGRKDFADIPIPAICRDIATKRLLRD